MRNVKYVQGMVLRRPPINLMSKVPVEWLTLPAPLKAEDVLSVAHQNAITFFTGRPFFANGGGERHIRLPYSFISIPEMEKGIHTLARIIGSLV